MTSVLMINLLLNSTFLGYIKVEFSLVYTRLVVDSYDSDLRYSRL